MHKRQRQTYGTTGNSNMHYFRGRAEIETDVAVETNRVYRFRFSATIGLGSMRSVYVSMPNRETPQEGVFSPMLFNFTLIPLAKALLTIPSLRSTLYADDIALWVARGPDGHIEHNLQEALDAVLRHTCPLALTCSPAKSGMLDVTLFEQKLATTTPIKLRINGADIPVVQQLKIVAFTVTHNRSPTPSL